MDIVNVNNFASTSLNYLNDEFTVPNSRLRNNPNVLLLRKGYPKIRLSETEQDTIILLGRGRNANISQVGRQWFYLIQQLIIVQYARNIVHIHRDALLLLGQLIEQ